MSRSNLLLLLVLFLYACGQKPPYHHDEELTEPVVFQEQIETLNGIAFSPDGNTLYISLQKSDTFQNSRKAAGIFKYEFQEEEWVGPAEVELDNWLDAYHPVLSKKGDRLFFNSRSHPDSGDVYLLHDIWYSEMETTGWGSPIPVDAINTEYYESYPSLAANGNLYFNSNRPGGKGGMDFYVSKFENGTYTAPIALTMINSEHEENDLVVDPDERFIIFNRYIALDRSIDLWISFNDSGQWSVPEKIDRINEPDAWELTPSLSPDGKYFFFEKGSKIQQIDLASILK